MCAQGSQGERGLRAGALFLSLCQFLRDSCRLRDHTSIMYPAGEGCLDRGHHVEIKEVIHPFYTRGTEGPRKDCAYRLYPWPESRGEERGAGEREKRRERGREGEGKEGRES